MTFLQAAEPTFKRIYFDFDSVSNGALPQEWVARQNGGPSGPEVYSNYIRASPTIPNNSNSQAFAGYIGDSVRTDNQIIRGTTRTALNGLMCGVGLRFDATMTNGVLAIITTDADRGIWTVINGALVKRSTFSASHAIGDTWALKADDRNYNIIRNPNFDGTGGTSYAAWTDTGGAVKQGQDNRFGTFYTNSDRNVFGTQNVAAGLDNFDFRDLGWTA